MAWQYFYWSETFTNRAGESLRVCLDKYGVRVDSMEEIADRKNNSIGKLVRCTKRQWMTLESGV